MQVEVSKVCPGLIHVQQGHTVHSEVSCCLDNVFKLFNIKGFDFFFFLRQLQYAINFAIRTIFSIDSKHFVHVGIPINLQHFWQGFELLNLGLSLRWYCNIIVNFFTIRVPDSTHFYVFYAINVNALKIRKVTGSCLLWSLTFLGKSNYRYLQQYLCLSYL